MAAQKNVLGLVYAGREVRRPPLVGMQFLHQRSVGTTDFIGTRPRLHAKDLISLLFRHLASARGPRIGARITSRLAPAWLPTIEIGCQQIAAVVVDFA